MAGQAGFLVYIFRDLQKLYKQGPPAVFRAL